MKTDLLYYGDNLDILRRYIPDESRAVSSMASVSLRDGMASLVYLYVGAQDNRFEDQSRMYRGSASHNITGVELCRRGAGRYWTDRESRGGLDFTARESHKAEDYKETIGLFDGIEGPR